jgi:hypothetical protein
MTKNPQVELSKRIEEVIQEHIRASQRAAADAVTRAFAAANGGVRGAPARTQAAGALARRRPSGEIAALGEQLYQAVCAKPGEMMAVLAATVGFSPRQLNRPMNQLKRRGQIRSVGQRHQTRYFPLAAKA